MNVHNAGACMSEFPSHEYLISPSFITMNTHKAGAYISPSFLAMNTHKAGAFKS